jgi:ornithine--oxo-acid transaminase
VDRVAHNYSPLRVTLVRGEGVWVGDDAGNRYLDMLAGYSALNFGHCHPALVDVAKRQIEQLTLTSRAFGNDQLEPFCAALGDLCSMECVLPMNTGAEAVETALKVARKWGYERKGIAPGKANIVTMSGNFHGRTTTIVSFSDDPLAREGFAPHTPGFKLVPFGDIESLRAAVDHETVAVLLEPVQGEGGVIIPPRGFLRQVRDLCSAKDVLMMADEIQSGLGRTGRTFACDHEEVRPDVYILGKALGGGLVPLSAVVANWSVLGVLRPGQHGSTFGGNPLACAIGRRVVVMLQTNELQERAASLGMVLRRELSKLPELAVAEARTVGLWAGLDLQHRTGRNVCEALIDRGVLCKDTHGASIRLAPPLIISERDLLWGLERIEEELATRPEAA